MDSQGSTLALSDGGGTTTTSYTYDPFGKTTVTGTSINAFQYTSRENDGTGLYFYRARYYSPQLHRFLGEDPILVPFTPLAKGLCLKRNRTEWLLPGQLPFARADLGQHVNPFLYLKNGPLNGTDPFGLEKKDECDTLGQECARRFTQQSGGQNNLSTCATTRFNNAGGGCKGDRTCQFLDAIDINKDCGAQPDPYNKKSDLQDCVKRLLDCNS